MRRFSMPGILAACLTLTALMNPTSTASAGDYCHAPQYYYKTVTIYETVRKSCKHNVIRYDHCGKPYAATVVSWKLVEVPVLKRIRVAY
jgi:hypothetical protein